MTRGRRKAVEHDAMVVLRERLGGVKEAKATILGDLGNGCHGDRRLKDHPKCTESLARWASMGGGVWRGNPVPSLGWEEAKGLARLGQDRRRR